MKQDHSNSLIPELLARVLTGEVGDEEIFQIEQWRRRDIENEKLYQRLLDSDFWKSKYEDEKELDVLNSYNRMIERYRTQRRLRIIRRVLGIAASFCLMILIPFAISIFRSSSDVSTEISSAISPGKVSAQLNLSDGTVINLRKESNQLLRDQEGTFIHFDSAGLIYENNRLLTEEVYNTLTVPRGGEYMITLGDGTRIFLNSETELRFPIQFIEKKRRVYLKGEAYFEVMPDSLSPFVVSIGTDEIEVLGTAFNVRCYPDEADFVTTLVNGQVCLKTGDKFIRMNPDEQVVVTSSGNYKKVKVNPVIYTAWKDGIFVFKHQKLDEVMRTLERWYDIEIEFVDAELKHFLFTGSIKRYDDFTKIVKLLSCTGNDIQFSIVGNKISISRNPIKVRMNGGCLTSSLILRELSI